MDRLPGGVELRGGGRGAYVSWGAGVAHGPAVSAAAAHMRSLRRESHLYFLLRHGGQPGGTGQTTHGAARGGGDPERRAPGETAFFVFESRGRGRLGTGRHGDSVAPGGLAPGAQVHCLHPVPQDGGADFHLGRATLRPFSGAHRIVQGRLLARGAAGYRGPAEQRGLAGRGLHQRPGTGHRHRLLGPVHSGGVSGHGDGHPATGAAG